MKSRLRLSKEEYEQYVESWNRLREIIQTCGNKHKLAPHIKNSHPFFYYFVGQYTQDLVDSLNREPTEEELIMIVDGGFNHFGAECGIDVQSRRFKGYVITY